jgi:hypothetical protein
MCSNITSIGLFSCSNIIASSNLTCSNLLINGNVSLTNALTINTLIVNSNLTCNKPSTLRAIYLKDNFTETTSSIYKITTANATNDEFICLKNQCITNKLCYSRLFQPYDPAFGNVNFLPVTDLTTIIDVDGRIPFSVIKGFVAASQDDSLAIASMILSSIAILCGLGAVATSVWSTFFNPTTGGVGMPGQQGAQGDQGPQGNQGAQGVSLFLVTTQGTNLKFVFTDTTTMLIPFTDLYNNTSFDEAVQRVISSTSLQGPTYEVGNIKQKAIDSVQSSINTVKNTTQSIASTSQNAVRNGLRYGGRVAGGYVKSLLNPLFEDLTGPQSIIMDNAINIIAPN